jgi:3'-phosphoadenosine 5'-phosphosulfate (PAPS) 3'-phosphatase
MNNWNIYELAELLSKCGKVAMNYYESPLQKLKADNSVVTIADKTV